MLSKITNFEKLTILEAIDRCNELTDKEVEFIDDLSDFTEDWLLNNKGKERLKLLAIKLELKEAK